MQRKLLKHSASSSVRGTRILVSSEPTPYGDVFKLATVLKGGQSSVDHHLLRDLVIRLQGFLLVDFLVHDGPMRLTHRGTGGVEGFEGDSLLQLVKFSLVHPLTRLLVVLLPLSAFPQVTIGRCSFSGLAGTRCSLHCV